MSMVRFADLVPVPWKNGLGTTREIAVSPRGATADDFLWRVSIADVDTASPFSRFPGVDRTIVLLDGDGFTMLLDGYDSHALTTPLRPFPFDGESSVDVTLAGGPTRDFNLMARRGQVRAHAAAFRIGAASITLPSDCVVAHVARGSLVVQGQTLHEGDSWLGSGGVQGNDDTVLIVVTARAL